MQLYLAGNMGRTPNQLNTQSICPSKSGWNAIRKVAIMLGQEEENYALIFLKTISALMILSSVVCGQTYTFSVLYSVEWLADESNVIVIAEYADDVTDTKPKILRTLKGQPEVVQWPLTRAVLRADTLRPDPSGRVRLLFIRGTAELLQSVQLRRGYTQEPSIREAFLGVSQFETLFLSERDFLRAIQLRLRSPRTATVARYRNIQEFKPEEGWIASTAELPLQAGNDYFSIVVPSDEERRDHFLRQLEEGNYDEKTRALYELASFKGERATEAIVKAMKCDYAEPVHAFPSEPEAAKWVRSLATSIYEGREKTDIGERLEQLRQLPLNDTGEPYPLDEVAMLMELPTLRREADLLEARCKGKLNNLPPVHPYGPPPTPFDAVTVIQTTRRRTAQFEKSIALLADLDKLKADLSAARSVLGKADRNLFSSDGELAKHLRQMKCKLDVMRILGKKNEFAEGSKMVELFESEFRAKSESMAEVLIHGNQLPPDDYSSNDREALLRQVESTWTAASPDRLPIHVGLVSNWESVPHWEIRGDVLVAIDRRQMIGYVLVSVNEETLVRYDILLRRDSIAPYPSGKQGVPANDDARLDASLVDTIDAEPSVQKRLTREKLARHKQKFDLR